MDALLIISVILFWLFVGIGLRHLYVFQQQKKELMVHVQETVHMENEHRYRKKEPLVEKAIKRLTKFADDFSTMGQRINFFSEPHDVEDWLRRSGYPFDLTVERFQGIKIFFALAGLTLAAMAFVIGVPLAHFGLIFMPLIGYFLPILYVKSKGKERQEKLRYDLPDFLDTVSVSLQAGVHLEQALKQIVRFFDGPLKEEFSRFLQEVELGVPREEAYRELLRRNDNPEFQSLIKSLIQGNRLGVPIAQTFKIQAEDMRIMRKEQAKEKAAKASPKITLITTFVITPAAIMMIAGLMILNMFLGDNSILKMFE
ncbi:type II secretion system F family protein [Priestia abyssalis]|uniref:type II secretion system F family protein n=1 Tax=Priestia abyssalis TaxID=1221450 RepID=UPI00099571AE|nr:type II secretion system F family protein [Priestia abyssalis]